MLSFSESSTHWYHSVVATNIVFIFIYSCILTVKSSETKSRIAMTKKNMTKPQLYIGTAYILLYGIGLVVCLLLPSFYYHGKELLPYLLDFSFYWTLMTITLESLIAVLTWFKITNFQINADVATISSNYSPTTIFCVRFFGPLLYVICLLMTL